MARSKSTPELRSLGAAFRDIRERRDERQSEVAARAQISAYHYRDIEHGRQPSTRATYLKIAAGLGISHDEMDDLLAQHLEGVAVR